MTIVTKPLSEKINDKHQVPLVNDVKIEVLVGTKLLSKSIIIDIYIGEGPYYVSVISCVKTI